MITLTVVTMVHHDSEEETPVDGWEIPQSYSKDITYDIPLSAVTELIQHSDRCQQYIKVIGNNSLHRTPTDRR